MNKCATSRQRRAAAETEEKPATESRTDDSLSLKNHPRQAGDGSSKKNPSSKERRRHAPLKKRNFLNIVDVEQEIQLAPNLSFGLGPVTKDFFQERPPTVMVNLRKTQYSGIWYMEEVGVIPYKEKWKYLHFPLEKREAREDDEEETYADGPEDNFVLSIAERLAKECEKKPVFIHAYDSQRAACVIALLTWHLIDPSAASMDPVQALHHQVFRDEPELTVDFPQYTKQRELLKRIITNRKKSIKMFFGNNNNNNKKQKA